MLNRQQVYLSTISPEAAGQARRYGLGLEIAEYCTAWNMDRDFASADAVVRDAITGIPQRLLHGPFNELFPCAIDPLARELAAKRFAQALQLAEHYGAEKLILHGGYQPKMYFSCWYIEQSVLFWREFLAEHPGNYTICLENVLEDTPDMLLSIVRKVEDPRLRLCLDVGHVNAYSAVSASDWFAAWEPWLSHLHVHNNDGSFDTHSALNAGTLDIPELLARVTTQTVTLELPEIGSAIPWMIEKELLTT